MINNSSFRGNNETKNVSFRDNRVILNLSFRDQCNIILLRCDNVKKKNIL